MQHIDSILEIIALQHGEGGCKLVDVSVKVTGMY